MFGNDKRFDVMNKIKQKEASDSVPADLTTLPFLPSNIFSAVRLRHLFLLHINNTFIFTLTIEFQYFQNTILISNWKSHDLLKHVLFSPQQLPTLS